MRNRFKQGGVVDPPIAIVVPCRHPAYRFQKSRGKNACAITAASGLLVIPSGKNERCVTLSTKVSSWVSYRLDRCAPDGRVARDEVTMWAPASINKIDL